MPLPGRRYGGKKSSTQAGPSTQTQRRQTQGTQGTQRGRRAAPEEEEEEEEEDAEEEGGEGGEDDGGASDDLERRVALLVRLALSVEHTRGTMRRDQINKVVFPNGNTRSFNHVLTGANDSLRKVFGLEIVELMTRAERDKVGAADDDAEEEAGPGRKKSKAGASSKTYVLRSALDMSLIALANQPDPQLAAAGEADLERASTRNKTVNAEDEETIAAVSRAGGSILGWDVGGEGEGEWYSVMCVVLGLVLVNGRSVADHTLRRLLKPLGLTPTADVPMPISTPRSRTKFQDFLGHLIKLGYLERQRAATANATGTQAKKRGRQSQAMPTGDDDEDGAAIEWRWGSRAHAEIGEKAVAEFMVDFMVERAIRDAGRALRRQGQTQADDEDEDEDEEGMGRGERREREKDKAALEERGKKMREAMMRDVERSAGGHLSEVGRGLK